MKCKFIIDQPDTVKEQAVDFINTFFPDLMPDIEEFAKKNNTDIGNISAITIKYIILPYLSDPRILRRE